MRRPISPRNSFFAAIWAIFHAGIFVAFLLSLLCGRTIRIDSDLFSMIPSSGTGGIRADADGILSQGSAQNLFILVSHEDFEKAKQMAQTVYAALSEHTEQFKELSLQADTTESSQLEDFIYANRYRLLPDEACREILSSDEGAKNFAMRAVMAAYSGFSLSSLDKLESDPFLLTDTEMRSYLAALQESGISLSPRDGVLATEFEGRSYVLIRGIPSRTGSKLASRNNAVGTIYSTCLPLEKDGYRFVFSGTPFHSYESSLSASREISIISTASLLLVLGMLIFTFRSPLPIALSLFSIVLSATTAFFATQLAFGKTQALVLVFGTSLIGCGIDYSLHFFINWKADSGLDSGAEIREKLFKGLLLSFISTQTCYLLLFFMPFPMLKQVAVFSSTGIASAFPTTLGLYPLLQMPKKRGIPRLPRMPRRGTAAMLALPVLALCAVAICTVVRPGRLTVKNDITRLYNMSSRLKEDATLSGKVLRYSPSSYFIISGATAEEVLRKEESLRKKLPDGYVATSRFIPSLEAQERSLATAEKLLRQTGEQLALFGMEDDGETERQLSASLQAARTAPLVPDGPVPEILQSLTGMLWQGEDAGRFFSIVIPSSITDEGLYQSFVTEADGVYFENKVKSINSSLDRLTGSVLIAFAIAYVAIIALLKSFYTWRQTLRIAMVPLASILLITAVFMLAGHPVDFFCTAGMLLVFGLGLDYVIYMTESGRRGGSSTTEASAVFLSFLTTELSFGALAFSSFVPIHIIGLCIFTGCLAAFLYCDAP